MKNTLKNLAAAAHDELQSLVGPHTEASVAEGWWTMREETLIAIMASFAKEILNDCAEDGV